MAIGISATKLEEARRNMMDYIEELNGVFNDLEIEVSNIQSNLKGEGLLQLNSKFTDIQNQYPTIKSNIMTYINDVENIISAYENQDQELSQQITKNIEKLTKEGSEENASN